MSDTPAMKKARKTPGEHAGPHSSFPITSQHNVDAAAHLIGKAADPAAVKAKVTSIAERKGFKVPDSWDKDRQNSNGLPRMTRSRNG
jgi:hypothetical protein